MCVNTYIYIYIYMYICMLQYVYRSQHEPNYDLENGLNGDPPRWIFPSLIAHQGLLPPKPQLENTSVTNFSNLIALSNNKM